METKRHLIEQLSSKVNEKAVRAAEEMRARGWLQDGSLEGAKLWRANLAGAILHNANLAGADLWGANLVGADLQGANLTGAKLNNANLTDADLQDANLANADLFDTNLIGTDLQGANLTGVDLEHANLAEENLPHITMTDLRDAILRGAGLLIPVEDATLQNAGLHSATFDENTTLPDDNPFGKRSFWIPDTDMTRFTNASHLNFWRSDDPESPAYRGVANRGGEK